MDEIQDGVISHRPPLVRIWLCGPFRIEWIDPITGETLPSQQEGQGRDVAQTHALLKLLLCQPERQAHRDWIMEQFWPDHDNSLATHRIENICSSLRKLLTPPTGGESLLCSQRGRRNRGTLYTLATYPQIWVDSDALAWNVQQAARMDRFGDESLPFWQRAFDLLTRGPLLADEPYAEWVTERREMHEGYYRQCVHALSQLYMARYGNAGKAEALLLLRTYWQEHKADEDALRPLLELLGEQERYQEAEAYYQQFLVALADLNPTEDGKPRKPDARTSDIHDYLSTKQIQRRPIIGTHSLLHGIDERLIPFSPVISQDIIQGRLIGESQSPSTIKKSGATNPLEEGDNALLQALLEPMQNTVKMSWLIWSGDDAIIDIGAELRDLERRLTEVLGLYHGKFHRAALHILGYIHEMLGHLAIERTATKEAIFHFQEMYDIADELSDGDMLTLAMIHQAEMLRRRGWYETSFRRMHTVEKHMQEAPEKYGQEISPWIQGVLWKAFAINSFVTGDEQQFVRTIDRAEEIAENTQATIDTLCHEFNRVEIVQVKAQGYTQLWQPQKALDIYKVTDALRPFRPVRDQCSYTIIKAQAHCYIGDLQQGIPYARDGLRSG